MRTRRKQYLCKRAYKSKIWKCQCRRRTLKEKQTQATKENTMISCINYWSFWILERHSDISSNARACNKEAEIKHQHPIAANEALKMMAKRLSDIKQLLRKPLLKKQFLRKLLLIKKNWWFLKRNS